ncbi:MAG: hypothetical protein MJE68_24580 [Proteobacteria bacterium]|nr:hypothetical protein [Pseudomonadota bacterium]
MDTTPTADSQPASPSVAPSHAPNVVVSHGRGGFGDLEKGHFIVVKPQPKPAPETLGGHQDVIMRNWQIGNSFHEALSLVVRQELGREIERITRSVIRAMVDSGSLDLASLGISR